MNSLPRNRFSGPVTVFHEQRLPETATPAGYAALIDVYALNAPWPRILYATGERHRIREEAGWRILTPPGLLPTLESHLTFALKYEGLDLAVLKRLFESVGPAASEEILRAKPTGGYARRLWYLYEWLLDQRLDLPDAESGRYAPVVDPKLQWAVPNGNSSRHRVRCNLPGTPKFCPMVFRTATLEEFVAMDLSSRAKAFPLKSPGIFLHGPLRSCF